jgi:hypothetical protein
MSRPLLVSELMDPISNVDRLVLVLRQRLLEQGRTASAGRKGVKAQFDLGPPTGLDQVHALAAVDDVDDRQLGRALIQSILTDHFGSAMLNEAKFQQVVDRVTDTLKRDPQLSDLFTRVVGELRQSAR